MAEKWKIEGTLFDACNCLTLCPCNYFQRPTGDDCQPAAVWHIEKGSYGSTRLDGLNFAGVMYARQNPLMGIEKAAFVMDEKATPQQREALTKVLTGQAGGMWSEMAKLVKNVLGVTWASFDYKNDEKSWYVKAGSTLDISGEFVKAPPGGPVKSEPKKAQTYDFLFGPTMEKTVGITKHYRANASGLAYDISGRYSSAGRFKYEGP